MCAASAVDWSMNGCWVCSPNILWGYKPWDEKRQYFRKNQFRCFSHLIDTVGLMVLAVRRKRCMSVKCRHKLRCLARPGDCSVCLPSAIANRQPKVPRPLPISQTVSSKGIHRTIGTPTPHLQHQREYKRVYFLRVFLGRIWEEWPHFLFRYLYSICQPDNTCHWELKTYAVGGTGGETGVALSADLLVTLKRDQTDPVMPRYKPNSRCT